MARQAGWPQIMTSVLPGPGESGAPCVVGSATLAAGGILKASRGDPNTSASLLHRWQWQRREGVLCHQTPNNRGRPMDRSQEHTPQLQSHLDLLSRLLLGKKTHHRH